MATNDPPNVTNDVRAVHLTIHTQLSSNPVINVSGIRVNESIRDVKDRIRMAIPSRPSSSNMKLIYRGHRRNDTDTLEAIFTPDAVRREANFTMHLVISDPASAQNVPPFDPTGRNTVHGSPQVPRPLNAGPFPPQPFHTPPVQGHPQAAPHLHPQLPNQMRNPPWPPLPPYQQPPNLFNPPQPLSPMVFQQGHFPYQLPAHQASDVNSMAQMALQSSMELSQRLQQEANRLREQLDQAPQSTEWERPRELMSQVTGQLQVLQRALNENPTSSNPEFQAELDRLQQRAQTVQRELDLAPRPDDEEAQSPPQLPTNDTEPSDIQGAPLPNGINATPMVTRQGMGPNGSSWTFTTTTSMPYNPQQGVPAPMEYPPNVLGFPPHLLASANARRRTAPSNEDPSWLSASHAISYLESLHVQLFDTIREYWHLQGVLEDNSAGNAQAKLLATRNRVCGIVQSRNAMQRTVNQVLSDGVPQGHTEPTEQQIHRLVVTNARFAASMRDFEETDREQREQIRSQAPTETGPSPSARPTVAYLLNSPQGPRGIVYSSTGVFRTSPASNAQRVPMAQDPNPTPVSVVPQIPQPASATRPPQPTPTTTAATTTADPNRSAGISDIQDLRNQLERELAAMRTNNQTIREVLRTARGGLPPPVTANRSPEPPLSPDNAAPQQAHPPNGNAQAERPPLPAGVHEHVVAINLTPFFQALWLFIRMYGIMWILMGGTGDAWTSWQFLTLIATSILYWAYQAGYGRQQVQDATRWWEGLTGGGPAVQAGQGVAGAGANGHPAHRPGNANANVAGAQSNANAPQATNTSQTADARPAQQQPRNALREAIRPFEQTVALLFASLWPGVGERHVAERERLRREEAEREVQRRRQQEEEEQARRVVLETAPAQASLGAGAGAVGGGEEGKASETGRTTEDGDASVSGNGGGQASSSAVAVQDTQQAGLTERRPGGVDNGAGRDW